MISKPNIHYLSHGKQVSGGYLHEKFLAENLCIALGSNQTQLKEYRQWKHFETPTQHLQLLFWAFKHGNAPINVVVARLAIPVLLRNLFNRNKVLVVWHYYDAYDGKGKMLNKWYHSLVNLSTWIPSKKLAFVAVAPFWQNFFTNYFKLKQVFLFPNFFDEAIYLSYRNSIKKKQIHLGQVSFKNSNELFLLAEKLTQLGYTCYFSTNHPDLVIQHSCYEVKYFERFEHYLLEMAQSEYTLAMPFIREGWNRVAHESLLVGSQVIGFASGGLGDLLKGVNAFVVGNEDESLDEFYKENRTQKPVNVVRETLEIIQQGKQKPIDFDFLSSYQTSKHTSFLTPILEWIRQ